MIVANSTNFYLPLMLYSLFILLIFSVFGTEFSLFGGLIIDLRHLLDVY